MTFPGTDAWYLDNVLGLIRNEKHEPIVWIMNLEDGERIITEHNALAGMDPAKLAALIEACAELEQEWMADGPRIMELVSDVGLGKSVAGGPFFAALVKLNNLAAQPQGDRGRALLAELEQYRELLQAWRAFWRQRHSTNELIAMEPYIGPRTELGMRFAAIDGAQS